MTFLAGSFQKVETVQDKTQDIQIAELDEKLKIIKQRTEGPKIKTTFEQKEESLRRHMEGIMAARELAAKQKAKNAESFKDGPDDLRDANKAVDDWLIKNIS